MTREKVKELLADPFECVKPYWAKRVEKHYTSMLAYACGGEIEVFHKTMKKWVADENPEFVLSGIYRVNFNKITPLELTKGEKALIKALRGVKLEHVYNEGESLLVYSHDNCPTFHVSHIAFHVPEEIEKRKAIFDALKQIKAENEA